MPLCCFGGICIPYTAVIPLVIVGIQWLLQKLINIGVIPESIGQQLHGFVTTKITMNNNETKETTSMTCCTTKDATLSSSSNKRRGKQIKEQLSTGTNEDDRQKLGSIEMIESKESWEHLLSSTDKEMMIICKFTAEWCKPCKDIQPYFESLVNSTTTTTTTSNTKFVVIDVDVCDDIASLYNIISLPSFISIQNGRVLNKYIGSNQQQLLHFITTTASSGTHAVDNQ
jgi:thioredoxin 1